MDCRPPNAPTFRTEYTPVPLTINLTIHRVWIRGSPLDHAVYFRIFPRLLKAEASTVKAPRTNSTLTDLENLVREYIFSHDSDDDKDRFHLLLMRPGQVHKKNERLIGRFEPWLEAKLQSGQEQRWRHASEEVQRARVVRADYMNAKRAWKIDIRRRAWDQELAVKKTEFEEQERRELGELDRREKVEMAELGDWSSGDC